MVSETAGATGQPSTYTITFSDASALVSGEYGVQVVDKADNSSQVDGVTDGFGIDTVVPVVSGVQMEVLGGGLSGVVKAGGVAKVGDAVSVTFTVSEALSGSPVVTILGRPAQAGLVQGSTTQ